MSRRAQLIGLAALIAIAVGVRIAWGAHTARPPVGLIDPTFYRGSALDLAHGEGYTYLGLRPSAYYPVGYPAALGAVTWLIERLGASGAQSMDGIVVWLHTTLAAASMVLVFLVARRAVARPWLALLAAALYGFWPNLVFHSSVALSETLFNTLVLAAVAVLATERGGTSGARLVVAGGLIGASALVRPISLLLVPVVAVLWDPRRAPRMLRRGLLVAAGALVLVLPWTIRNLVVLDSPVLISSNLGDNLCIGHHDGASGAFSIPDACFDGYGGPEDELRRNRELTRAAIGWAARHPLEEVELVGRRAYHTFRDDRDGLAAVESYGADAFLAPSHRRSLMRLADGWYALGAVAGVAGLVLLARRRDDPIGRLLAGSAVASVLPVLVFFGDPRFKVPVVPFLAIGGAVAIGRLAQAVRRGARDPAAAG